MTSPALTVRTLTPEQHLDFLRTWTADGGSASFLQTPAWGTVKSEWRRESIGWYDPSGRLVGAGLVLYRQLPKVKRYLAYLPEGPVLDWDAEDLRVYLNPMVRHLKKAGAFGVRMGPPVVTRRWDAAAVKQGVADASVRRLGDVPPSERSQAGARVVSQLQELGWRPQQVEGGFAAGQPQYNFQIPLRDAGGAARTGEDVLAGMNQQWRRNIKKAAKAGVEVTHGTPADLPAFHELYALTAERDHFTPRPLSYFQTMFSALLAEEPDRIRLYLARHEGDLVAATVWVRVGGHTWYSYGASSTEKRDVRGSNAVQWAMISDSLAAGADVYDLRGITDTLDPDDSHVGLIQFKVGTGGEAVEYAGEWDLPLNPVVYKAFSLYMSRR
ncbi:lipid II:glycine glycyltransferase FemX [Nocardioides panacis]|uniref:lipid II:glycine glycyltransferase FemX n=1 Tax=Nocardioides panacis TaxID=2849501 RepID=UPI0020B1D8DF|nr:peptidoglycan bridge formation glycyltransferase FemA/FemB family protein [Nocardioides panacis]